MATKNNNGVGQGLTLYVSPEVQNTIGFRETMKILQRVNPDCQIATGRSSYGEMARLSSQTIEQVKEAVQSMQDRGVLRLIDGVNPANGFLLFDPDGMSL